MKRGLSLGLGVLSLSFGSIAFAAINTDVALVPAKGQFILRTQYSLERKGGDRTNQNRSFTAQTLKQVVIYGLTGSTAGFLVVPYQNKDLRTFSGGQRVSRQDSGIADLKLLLKQRLWKKDEPGGTTRLSFLAGVELPTGEHHAADGIGRLPPAVRLGSGSVDPIAGAVFTRQTQWYQLSQDFVYQVNTGHDDLQFGDVLRHDTGMWLRVWPKEFPEWEEPKSVHAVLEFNGIWQGKNRSGGTLKNSGGYTLFVSPGIQYVTPRWLLEASVQLPMVDSPNGNELGTDWIIVAGARTTF